ncbi:MAG: LysR family transcriptional regulator [Chromatiaceae bacterium]|nr:LysR family transcriptional regulator [Chromatiaceae bacterium]
MNWDDLRLFLAVARNGSISGGAKTLELQHSTVSRRMRKLEEDLGVRLFEKMRNGYELTVAGEKLKVAAGRMECEALDVDGALSGKDTRLAGTLRVTAINNMATTVLMPMFTSFSRRYPEVALHIMVSNSDASLAQREADVAVRLSNAPPDTLIGKRVTTVASTVYGSYQYLDALRENGGEPQWLGVECCVFHKSWTKKSCGGQSHRFFVDDTLLTQAALREGMGVSILPCFMGDPDPSLERFCDPDPEWNLGMWLLLHPDLKRTARVLAFRDHMLDAIKAKTDLFEGRLTY